MANMCWLQFAVITVILFQSASGKAAVLAKLRKSQVVNPDETLTGDEHHPGLYNKDLHEGDMIIHHRFGGQNRNVLNDKYSKWPNKTVPYEFAPGFNAAAKAAVTAAIADYQKYSCVRYVPRTNEKDYVQYIVDDGCYSYVGRSGGKQPISIGHGCEYKGIAIHEMLHTVGFFHEQSRTDRDDHITIDFDSVEAGMNLQFQKITKDEEITYGTSYDYESVMHYGRKAFSKNGKDTITPKDPNAKIGQRQGFSETDLEKLNKHYDCTEFLNKHPASGQDTTAGTTHPPSPAATGPTHPPSPTVTGPTHPPTTHTTAAPATTKKRCLVEHWTCPDFKADCNRDTARGRYIKEVCLQTCKTCVD